MQFSCHALSDLCFPWQNPSLVEGYEVICVDECSSDIDPPSLTLQRSPETTLKFTRKIGCLKKVRLRWFMRQNLSED